MQNKMKHIIFSIIVLASVFGFSAEAQRNMIFRYKAEGLYGSEIHTVKTNGAGGELALELPLFGNKNWHYTYNFPTTGFALGYMQLMGIDSLSRVVFTYPYFLYPFVHTPMLAINLRMGAGMGAWLDANQTEGGYQFPYFNFYTGGLTFDVFLGQKYGNPLAQWQLEFGANAMILHDCYIDRRTDVMVIPNVNLGLKYTPNVYPLPIKHPARKVHKVMSLEASAQGGVNQLDVDDGNHYYPNISINGGLYYPFSNAYRMGFGLDLFYNDIYDGKQRTNNRRYNFITSDHFENHLRGGIFWANDLTIDRFTAGIHIGFYPYNPIRVPESYEGYTNDNLTENFLYWKFVTKYHFSKHLYVTTQVKSHMQKVEDFEVGLGYCMPDFGDRVKNPFSRLSFKKEDPNELKVEGETNTKHPFRHRSTGDE